MVVPKPTTAFVCTALIDQEELSIITIVASSTYEKDMLISWIDCWYLAAVPSSQKQHTRLRIVVPRRQQKRQLQLQCYLRPPRQRQTKHIARATTQSHTSKCII
jgi:hypothetical protein